MTGQDLPVAPGAIVTFQRRVLVSDVSLYAGITGDFSPNHVDEGSDVGGRIAHGTLLIGLMSTASSLLHERHSCPTVSLGYDRVRFTRPVRIGTLVTIRYEVIAVDPVRRRSTAEVTCTDESGATVAVATHIAYYLREEQRLG